MLFWKKHFLNLTDPRTLLWVLKILQCVQEAGDFYNEEVWHSSAINLGMKLTEQEILEVYNKANGT